MNGFLLIDKQPNWTSFDICAKARKIFNIKKVGHTGTLDPFATGLLIVAIGKCTKLIPHLEKADKTYITKIIFGKTSETLDPESEISDIDPPPSIPTKEEIEKILANHFTGKIQQTPPAYSAIKINGKKMCNLARTGKKIEIKPRETKVFKSKIRAYKYPEIEIEIKVQAGFYVRSFAQDLGIAIGTKAICQELRRTYINNISVHDAETIDHVSIPIDPKFICKDLPQCEIPSGRIQDFIAGRAFRFPGIEGKKYLVLCGGKTIGAGEFTYGNLQPKVVL